MQDESKIAPDRPINGQPSRDIENAVSKLWEFIHNAVEENKKLKKLYSEMELSYLEVTKGIDKQESQSELFKERTGQLEARLSHYEKLNEDYQVTINELNDRIRYFTNLEDNYNELLETYEKAKSSLTDLQEISFVSNDLAAALEEEQKQKSEALEEISALKKKLDEYEDQLQNLAYAQKEIVRKNKEIFDLTESITGQKAVISELQSKIYELSQAKLEADEYNTENGIYREKIASLEEEIKSLEIMLGAAEKTAIEKYDQKIKEEEEKNKDIWQAQQRALQELTRMLDEEKNARNLAEVQYNKIVEDSARKLNEYEVKIRDLQAGNTRLQDLETQIFNKEQTINKLTEEKQLLTDIYNNSTTEINKLNSHILEEENKANIYLKQIAEEQARSQQLQEARDEYEKALGNLNNQIFSLTSQIALKDAALTASLEKIEALQARCSALDIEANARLDDGREIEALKQKLSSAEQEINLAQQKMMEMSNDTLMLEKRIKELETGNKEYEKEIQEMASKAKLLELRVADFDRLNEKYAQLSDELIRVKANADNSTLIEENQKYRKETEELRKELEILIRELKEKDRSVKDLENRMALNSEELEISSRKIHSLESIIGKMENEKAALDEKKEQLIKKIDNQLKILERNL